MSKTRRIPKPPPSTPSEELSPAPPSRRFQFSLRTMFISTALCCVLAAVWGGLLRAVKNPDAIDSQSLVFFLVLAVGAPMFIMMAAGLIAPLRRIIGRLRRRQDEP